MSLSHETLSYLAVRINVKDKIQSSGFLFLPNADSEYFYILTAKHCLYGKTFKRRPRNRDIKVFFYAGEESKANVEYILNEGDKVVIDSDNQPDLALIQIPRVHLAALITWEVPVTLLADFNPTELKAMFKGFPHFTGGTESRTVQVKIITTDSNDKVIQTEVGTSYDASNGFAEDNVEGFSGSGLCVEVNDQIYLFGIIFKYEAPGRRFHSSGIRRWLSSKLPKVNWYNTSSERLLPMTTFKQNIRDAINLLGPRYTEDFTFNTLIKDVFQPLSSDYHAKHLFLEKVKKPFKAFDDFQITFGKIPLVQQESLKEFLLIADKLVYVSIDITYNEQIKVVRDVLSKIESSVQTENLLRFDRVLLAKFGRELYENTYVLYQGLQQYIDLYDTKHPNFIDYIESVRKLSAISEDFLGYTNSDEMRLLVTPYLLISGKAGTGKSHLLADIAQSRLDAGKPTLLFLGQNFNVQEDPWQTILKFTDFKGSSEELLKVLNEKGQILGERIFIMIDAINEGQGLFIWKTYLSAFVESFESFPYVGLVLSYRTTYKPVLFSDPSLTDKFKDVEHTGFAGFEAEAFRAFAKHYKIERRVVPILTAEFGNPLFLKLLCLGLKTDPGYYYDRKIGIDRVFHYYIAHVNEQLATKTFDYNYIKINLVNKAIKIFTAYQIQHQLKPVSYESAYLIVEDAVGRFVGKRRFLDSLISENIFIDKIRAQNRYSDIEFFVDFAYERLGDHMIARYLLNLVSGDSQNVFENEGILYDYISSEKNQRRYQGLIEAMSIQWPERFGVEFFQALPEVLTYSEPIMIGFLGSLAWRIESIDTQILDSLLQTFIERKSKFLIGYFWNTNIELTLDSSNEFNARYLHDVLMGMSMAKRDELWTTYLQHQYPGGEREINPIARLLRWTWKVGLESEFESETIILAATTLTWFLTSANRGLRDVTTKALIHLFSFYPQLIKEWMGKFLKVNDPYVLQRVYAVALGCAIKMREQNELKSLADYIYKNFFNIEDVYPDILMRDYARLVIEFAVNQGVTQSYDLQKIRPPYQSVFPQDFPTNEEIEAYRVSDKKGKEMNYLWSIDSILDSMVTEYGRGTSMYGDFGRYTFESALRDWKKIDTNLLSNLAVQWIFDKYQYNAEAFGEFDQKAGDNHLRTRSVHKERIGKKYQWIAFYEILARVSDNKPFHPNDWSPRSKAKKYNGPWEPYVRDIDPTFIHNPLQKKQVTWLPKQEYSQWNNIDNKWLRDIADLPDPVKMLAATDDLNEEWLVLELYGDWSNNEQGEYSFSKTYQRLWYQIRSYIVAHKSYENMTSALKETNFMGRWMPESRNEYTLYNREFFWSPANVDLNKSIKPWSMVTHQRKNIGKVVVTTQQYLWEEEFDNSKEGTISIFKPSQFLYDLLELRDGLREGEFVNEQGTVVCFDPSVNYDAPSCLLVRKRLLHERLKAKRLDIFWTVLGEKQVIKGNEGSLEFSGLVKLIGDKLVYEPNFNKV